MGLVECRPLHDMRSDALTPAGVAAMEAAE